MGTSSVRSVCPSVRSVCHSQKQGLLLALELKQVEEGEPIWVWWSRLVSQHSEASAASRVSGQWGTCDSVLKVGRRGRVLMAFTTLQGTRS